MSAFDDRYSVRTSKRYWSPIRERPSVKAASAIVFVWLMTSTMQYCSAQNLREWQSKHMCTSLCVKATISRTALAAVFDDCQAL